MELEFVVVVIKGANNLDRLYCEKPGQPRLWENHCAESNSVVTVLEANGIRVRVVKVKLKTED